MSGRGLPVGGGTPGRAGLEPGSSREEGCQGPPRPAPAWPRLALVQAVQLPAVALLLWGRGEAALWTAALWGSIVCCAGTDSGWRWLNRLLILQAAAWLAVALVLGIPG